MIRAMATEGIPIICMRDDCRIGYIDTPVYDKDGKVLGFLAEIKGTLLGKRFISLNDILKIDNKACIIYSENCIKKRRYAAGGSKSCKQKRLSAKEFHAAAEAGVGVVRDIMFNTETGEIEGLEVSRGLFDDISMGRRSLLLRDCTEFGEDNIIIDDNGELI